MPRLAQLLPLALLVILGGCAAPDRPRQATILSPPERDAPSKFGVEDPAPSPAAVTPEAPAIVPPASPTESVQPPPPPRNEAPPLKQPALIHSSPPLKPVAGWVPYRNWSRQNGLEHHLVNGIPPNLTLEQHTPAGTLALAVGSRYARWNGLSLGLGFAPIWLHGEPCIHSIDAAKTLDLLLNSAAYDPKPVKVLVIDPGHGGANFGTRSVDGRLLEKDLTLDWARRIQKTLQGQRSGWTVFLTRTNDTELNGMQRVAIADAARADLFISLHFNSVANGADEAGLETYCTTPLGLPSNLVREFEDDPTRLYPNNQFDFENLYYALRLHRTLVEKTGRKDRGLRRARFMTVVREQNRPAALIEGGYLSNPKEARLIATPEFRQKLAEAVIAGLMGPEEKIRQASR